MTACIISAYAFFIMFGIAYFLPKYNNILFMVQLDKNFINTEPFCTIVNNFRKKCFNCAVLLSVLCPLLESNFIFQIPFFFISLGLSVYLFIIFALFLTSSRKVLNERISASIPKDSIAEKAEIKAITEFYHYLLHSFIVVKLIKFTFNLPYEYISLSMLEYPVFCVITVILALIANKKFRKQGLMIYFISLFLITAFALTQQVFFS